MRLAKELETAKAMTIASNVPPAVVQNAAIACIGPQTAATAQDLGLQVDLVATEATVGGLVDALVAHFSHAHSKE